jgi:hypothetical protein
MFKYLIRFIKKPIVRNCLTGRLMLNIKVSYIHINNIQGYVSEDLGYVINSCCIVSPKKVAELFKTYRFAYKSNGIIYRLRNIFN